MNHHAYNIQDLFHSQLFVREIKQEQETLQLIVEEGEVALPIILRTLNENGLDIRTITLDRPSLDDVFLMQTGRSLREEIS
jgi:ABC-2 type transport system ATP-binding protein